MAETAGLDWTPGQLAEMLNQVAQIMEHQSPAVYEDPEVRVAVYGLRQLLGVLVREEA